jgi:predicted transcriptional regulator
LHEGLPTAFENDGAAVAASEIPRAVAWKAKIADVGSSNSFGTFLETRDLMRKAAEPEPKAADPRSAQPSQELTESAVLSLSLVTDHAFPVEVPELLKASGMPLRQFMEALNAIRNADLVEVRTEDGRELVALTPRGKELQEATRER